MASWTGARIQALSLHRKVGSDSWLPTRGLMSRENFPFFVAYAWTLQQVIIPSQALKHLSAMWCVCVYVHDHQQAALFLWQYLAEVRV